MYRENKTITSSYDEKALFLVPVCRLSISVSYCLITKKSVATKVLRHYSIVLFKRLNNLPRLIKYIDGTFQTQIVSEVLIMTTKCILCNAIVHPLRSKLGIDTCIHCGDKQAKQRKHCIVPMHKSNYIVVTDRDDLVRINNKSG